MTREENALATALDIFGSDTPDEAERDILRGLRSRAYHDTAVPVVRSTNFDAVLEAVTARGPRCDRCGGWTFRPYLRTRPAGLRFCGHVCQYLSVREGAVR